MKKAVEIAQFRQLCSLGVEPAAVMPTVLTAAHHLVGSDCSAFVWADEKGDFNTGNSSCVLLAETTSLFAYRLLAKLPHRLVREAVAARRLRDLFCVSERVRAASRYYAVPCPGGPHHLIAGVARNDQGRVLGKLVLVRSRRAPEFSGVDRELLARLLPYMSTALEPRKPSTEGYARVGAPGLVAVMPDGRVSHAGKRARALLALADEPDARGGADAPPVLLQQRLRASFTQLVGQSGRAIHGDTFEHQTQWGRFVFRCERLEERFMFGNSLVVASIDHHQPAPLIRMHAMQAAGLSARQMQICLLLCEQRSLDELACEAGISRTTVKDHVRNIYLRFDVHTREELMSRLLTYGSISSRSLEKGESSAGDVADSVVAYPRSY